MKKFFDIIMPIKTSACFGFSAIILLYTAYTWFAGCAITQQAVVSFMLISLVSSVLQCVAFSTLVIKKLSYALRLAVFAVLLFAVLLLFARLFDWVPLGKSGAWLIFFVIFAVIFILLTVFFEFYFHLSGRKYDGMLGEYQARHKPQD